MKKIAILGTGGNCTDILDTILDINDRRGNPVYECIGFFDDNPQKWKQKFHGVGVLGPLKKAISIKDCSFVFGIGSVSNFWKRKDILAKTGIADECFETIIHPTASVSRMAKIGKGAVIFQNVTITSNVIIGRHVSILPNSIISHDDEIGDYTCIAGGVCVSGSVRVGTDCYLGTNSSIKDGLAIGNQCLIGMGSVVINDVPENSVVAGSPARFLRNTQAR
jgi:sugar O-acyltransferase (sialic acid O-acetyltransferase NeuD family)